MFDDSTSAVDTATDVGARIRAGSHGSRAYQGHHRAARELRHGRGPDAILDDGRVHATARTRSLAHDPIFRSSITRRRQPGDGGGRQWRRGASGAARPRNMRHTLRRFVSYMGHAKFHMLAVTILVGAGGRRQPRRHGHDQAGGQPRRRGRHAGLCLHGRAHGRHLRGRPFRPSRTRGAGRSWCTPRSTSCSISGATCSATSWPPLSWFDRTRNGDVMSYFTNDVDTISEALNNSFANMLQAAIQTVGTLVLPRAQLAAHARDAGLRRRRVAYTRSRARGQSATCGAAAHARRARRLRGGDDRRPEGRGRSSTTSRPTPRGLPQPQRGPAPHGHKRPGLRPHHGPHHRSIGYVNYAVVAVLGATSWPSTGRRTWAALASYLSSPRQATRPLNQLTQLGNFVLTAPAGAGARVFGVMELAPRGGRGQGRGAPRGAQGRRGEKCGLSAAWPPAPRAGADPAGRRHGAACRRRAPGPRDLGYEEGQHGAGGPLALRQAPAGRKIAFVGSTEVGKTTITNLINRFYDVRFGAITSMTDRRARHPQGPTCALHAGHRAAGHAPVRRHGGGQHPLWQAGRHGRGVRPRRRASPTRTLHPEVSGYDTRITSSTAPTSSGPAPAHRIARAAVSDPPVLILDEATSSIDTRTELPDRARHGRPHARGRTVFAIAHRLSTVRNANAIMVLEHGRNVERGTHEELLAQHGEQLYTGKRELTSASGNAGQHDGRGDGTQRGRKRGRGRAVAQTLPGGDPQVRAAYELARRAHAGHARQGGPAPTSCTP